MWNGGYSLCHLKITAGGGPRPKSTNNSISSTPLRKSRENKAERKTSPWLPPTQQEHTCRQFCCQQNSLWRFRELFSSDICHCSSPMLLSFPYIFFFKQCHRRCKLHLPQCTLSSSLVTGTLKPDTLHWRLLFTLALAPGLTVTPLHFHINST